MSSPAVQVQPDIRFGEPHFKGIGTETIADMYWVGDDVEDDYELTRHELLVVLWFEASYGRPRYRRRWKAWGAEVGPVLWSSSKLTPATVELPPTRETYNL